MDTDERELATTPLSMHNLTGLVWWEQVAEYGVIIGGHSVNIRLRRVIFKNIHSCFQSGICVNGLLQISGI